MKPFSTLLRGSLFALPVLLVGVLLFLAAMERGLNHDEHQFLAPGALIAREGLVPYSDFPIFHLPNLAYLYAALDHFTHQPIFSAKLLSTVATTSAAALILAAATLGGSTPLTFRNCALGLTALVLLLGDQLFVYSTGKTWNHEVPAFLLVAAIAAQVRGVRSGHLAWLLLSGLCAGLAVGTRLTYAPTAVVFPLMLITTPLPHSAQLKGAVLWGLGCSVGLGPSIYFLCEHREQFLFDNFRFPRLRLEDVSDTRVQKTMTWWRKLRYFWQQIVSHSLPLFLATGISVGAAWRSLRTVAPSERHGLLLALAVLPAALLGCFLPSRYQYQHYFVLAPLLALIFAYATRLWSLESKWVHFRTLGLAVLFLASLLGFHADPDKPVGGFRAYAADMAMLDRKSWFITRFQEEYAPLKAVRGKVLTLAPAGVLEVGGKIYPEFVTGPFAWRGAGLVAKELRARCKLVVAEDLVEFLRQEPPAAVLTGVEDAELEAPLVEYAKSNGSRRTKLSKRRVLWLAPSDIALNLP